MKRTTTIILFLLCTAILWGQSSVQQLQIIPASPQAQSFQKYLNHQITEYNGLPEIDIPLYELKVKGLTIPVTLSYHASGIRYKQYDGEVGAGWSLNAGGYRVSRTINGRDDFYYERYDRDELSNFQDMDNGYKLDAYLSSMIIWKEEYGVSQRIDPWKINIDGEYDQFTYMLPSSNGEFLILERDNLGGAAQTVKIKNNLDKLAKVAWNEAHIIDGNGFNYYFGGKQDNTNLYELAHGSSATSPTSWPLRQIVSPFNDVINFRYEKFTQEQSHRGKTLSIHEPWLGPVSMPDPWGSSSEEYSQIMENLNSTTIPSESPFRYDDQFHIQKIETEDIIVEFKRDKRLPGTEILPPSRLIKEIVVTNKQNNEVERRFVLNYKSISIFLDNGRLGGYAHHLLESVTVHSKDQSEQKYNLEYYGSASMTSSESNCLYADQWGFYKNSYGGVREPFLHREFESDKYVSSLTTARGHVYPVVSLVRNLINTGASLDRSNNDQSTVHYFSLKKITYPTGGYSEYEFEPHKFRNPSAVVTGGGQRIKKIKSVAADSEEVTTIFKYGENENGIGVANIHFSKDMFADETHYISYTSTYYRKTIRSYSNKPFCEIDNSMLQVSYPQITTYQVREADGMTNGKTVSRYDIYQQYIIDYLSGTSEISDVHATVDNGYSYPKGIRTYRPGYIPLLTNRSYYNNENIKIREEQYEYGLEHKSNDPDIYYGISLKRKVYFDSYYNVGTSPYDYITSAYDCREYTIERGGRILSKKTITNYDLTGTHPATIVELYEYNTRNQLTVKITKRDCCGTDDLIEEYTYPSSDTELVRRNMLSTVIEKEQIESNNGLTLYNECYHYPNGAVLPDYFAGLYSRIELTYDRYDGKGNLLQCTRLDGTPVSYIWSYNYRYPVAEIVGATYNQVSAALNMNMTALASNKNPSESIINSIKSLKTSLPNAFVTICTYKPLTGMLTATDPSGVTTYYEYDSFNRLKRTYIKENTAEKNIRTYNYHYQSPSSGQNYILARTYTQEDGSHYLDKLQYFDGLGRPVQTVECGVTPNMADLVVYREYDSFDRESNVWLPTVISGNNGAYVQPSTFKAQAIGSNSNDANPYSTITYEASPLNRVLKRFAPGQDWHNADKAVGTSYKTNISGDALLNCKRYTDASRESPCFGQYGNYDTGTLHVTEVKDENGNTSYEFRNKLDQIILIRQINEGRHYDTYYVYNDYGNLSFVLPPRVQDEGASDGLIYQYKYDWYNRLIAKRIPGCDWDYYIYDKADRLIFSQNGEQRAKGEWTFTIPDALGRVVLSGICTNNFDYMANPLGNSVAKAEYPQNGSGMYEGYNLSGVSLAMGYTILAATYYDTYKYRSLTGFSNTALAYETSGVEAAYLRRYGTDAGIYEHKGLVTGTKVAQLHPDGTIGSSYLYTCLYYDIRKRLIQSVSTNHLEGIEKEYIAYNFIDQPVKKTHVHTKNGSGGGRQTEVYAYTYDHAGRLLKITHQLNGGMIVTLAENTYDELGRLKTNKKGGVANTTTTYTYNVHSWIKSVSSALFSQTLYYNESYGGSAKQYNGNISAMSWKQNSETNYNGYAFTYDGLSRLTAADYLVNGVSSTHFRTAYMYDKHGNMTSLQRYGKKDVGTGTSSYGPVDDLTMTYVGNQLTQVDDAVGTISFAQSMDFKNYSNAAVEYTYNANGAMTKDLNKGISDIRYNSLNLPRRMDIKSPVAEARNEYTYSASGTKLKVVQKWNPSYSTIPVIGSVINTAALSMSKTTDYVGNFIYENNVLKRILINGGYIENGVYHYYLTDHQGNNRIVVNASGVIVQRNNYYPFGTTFGDNTVAEQGKQPYKYNSKELDQMHGLNWYDYSARWKDDWRFMTVDPLAEKYYSTSPYVYCANSPSNNVDLDGKSWYSYNQDGKTIYEWNINIRSQEDLDKIRENAIYIGNTHSDGDTYYSLFGNKYSMDSKEGKTMEKIDEALINYSQASLKYDYYGNLISGGEKVTDFDIGEYPQKNSLNLNEDAYFTFQTEGGSVTYFKVSEGVNNKAKFGGFGYVTKGKIRGQGNRGAGNLEDGIPIYFERQNTPGNIVQRSAQIVFPTQKAADTFYQKYSLILKRK